MNEIDSDSLAQWQKVRNALKKVVGDSNHINTLKKVIGGSNHIVDVRDFLREVRLLEETPQGIDLVAQSLQFDKTQPWTDRWSARFVGYFVSGEAKIQLFPYWLSVAVNTERYYVEFLGLILTLPKEWLSSHIMEYLEPLLDKADRENDQSTYAGALGILGRIDNELQILVAKRALKSPDIDIREHGEYVLNEYALNEQ